MAGRGQEMGIAQDGRSMRECAFLTVQADEGFEAREMAFHSLGQFLPRQAPIYRPLRGTATSVPSPPALAGLSGATSRMRAYGQSFRAYVLRNDIVQFDNQTTTAEVGAESVFVTRVTRLLVSRTAKGRWVCCATGSAVR